jgi:hypothetical protein
MSGQYGTNEGDCWVAPWSEVQEMLDADGEGLVLVHEMVLKDGVLEECMYTTANPELIERARKGYEKLTFDAANRN